jgi:two-component sensor histidine kinase
MDQDAPNNQQMARIRRYQEILTDFGRMAPDASDDSRVLNLACVQAARGIGIGHTKVLRFRPECGDLLIVAGVGWRPGVVGHAALGTDLASPPGRTFQTRQPTVIDDLPNDHEFRYSAVLRDHGIVSVLQAPIAVGGAMWGVMEVDSETLRHFGADDVQFLSALANILGLALHGRHSLQQAALAEAAAAKALAQERTLLAELRHRSKNDLQLILAMLVMQKRKQPDKELNNGLNLLMDRVAAIGMAHDQLAPGRVAGMVELSEYLTTLCGNLAQRRESVRIEIAFAPTEMPHERAVPLGLVVNELVTNALKYAFPDDRSGRIEVLYEIAPLGQGRLTVRDDGIGMGPPRPGGAGTELVRRLIQQIGGWVERKDQAPGTCIEVTFPLVT